MYRAQQTHNCSSKKSKTFVWKDMNLLTINVLYPTNKRIFFSSWKKKIFFSFPSLPYFFFYSISFYYEFSKEQDYICSKPEDSGMHLCSNLPPYRIGPLVCNSEYSKTNKQSIIMIINFNLECFKQQVVFCSLHIHHDKLLRISQF